MVKKNFLPEVVLIRLLLVFLLVFYHAFAIYSGKWQALPDYPNIQIYWWLDKLSYAFMLEAFVFISGYVLGYQVRTKGEQVICFKRTILGKVKRLIIPSIIFSALYMIIFQGDKNIGDVIYGLFNGVGHMWFLPMLFWCFVSVFIIEKLRISPRIVIPFVILCSICSFVPLPLRMTNTMYYFVFFYIGYLLQKAKFDIKSISTCGNTTIAIASFTISFLIFTPLCDNLVAGGGKNNLIIKAVYLGSGRILKLIYSSLGVLSIVMLFTRISERSNFDVSLWTIKLSTYCFGVYIFQQFILKGIYYYTDTPKLFGCYWLPWISFVFTLVISILLSYLFNKTKVGKFLIG